MVAALTATASLRTMPLVLPFPNSHFPATKIREVTTVDNTTPWNELFDKEHEPQHEQIKEFVDTPLWEKLTNSLQQAYAVKPRLSYSSCAMERAFGKGGT